MIFCVQSEKVEIADSADLSGNIRAQVEDAFRRGKRKVTIQDESEIVEYPLDETIDKRNGLSIDKTLSLLAGIRGSYK